MLTFMLQQFYMLKIFEDIDLRSLLLGEEKWSFLVEAMFRTVVMFLVIVITLRMLGKRGVKQLSVFELGVIIGLGSAAGDPMFYKDVGLLQGIIVFTTVIALYRFVAFLINKSNAFERFVEGTSTCLIENGKLLVDNFEDEPIALDELYSQLRLRSVSHLGQVHLAIVETNGEVSVFYFPDEEVKHGLPIVSNLCGPKVEAIEIEDIYACTFCGNVEKIRPTPSHICSSCKKKEWTKALDTKRIK